MIRRISLDELRARLAAAPIPLVAHSGEVSKGAVFALLPPAVAHGQDEDDAKAEAILREALQANPSVLVCSARQLPLLDSLALDCEVVVEENMRSALGLLARSRYGTGAEKPLLVGITGTNGKTSTTYMLEKIFSALGYKIGVIGTISRRWPGYEEESSLTTPGCLALHSMLADMRVAEVDYAFMEISSHALDQDRVAGLDFSAALLTNVTQDHLDYHRNMEDYFKAKAKIFLPPEQGGLPLTHKKAVLNADDPYGSRLLAAIPQAIGFGLSEGDHGAQHRLYGRILNMGREGTLLSMRFAGQSWKLTSPLTGTFNAMNLLGAQALGLTLGLSPADFAVLSAFAGAPGRLERIANPKDLNIFVDYAHTPDALTKALSALRAAGFARIVTVFGCGGNRDRAKRPLMGKAVAELSDVAVLTSDNPRDEDPLDIMNDVLPGLVKCPQVISEPDRRVALSTALELLRGDDALLVAGKGHESYQLIRGIKHPFQDQTVLQELTR